MLVQNISYAQAIRSIREIILDTGLVQCFKVSGQGLPFKKTPSEVTLGTVIKPISDAGVLKLYDLIALLVEKEVAVEILPDYVATEYISGLFDFDYNLIAGETKILKAKNYFSNSVIETVMIEFFSKFLSYDGHEHTTESIFEKLNYFQKGKLILWVAYYLVDRRRMFYASTSILIGNANGATGSSFKNTTKEVTTRIGDVYTETERDSDNGKGLDGFTSLWGDQDSYLTRLQLYIRDKYEKLFNDFSLRDNAMISQTFTMVKTWENDAWLNTLGWSSDTYGLFVENR